MRIFQNARAYFTLKILTLGRGCDGLTVQSTRQLCKNKPSSFVPLLFSFSLSLFALFISTLSFYLSRFSNDPSFYSPCYPFRIFRINFVVFDRKERRFSCDRNHLHFSRFINCSAYNSFTLEIFPTITIPSLNGLRINRERSMLFERDR